MFRPAGDVGEHLARVGADGVVVEVMLGNPDGLETLTLGVGAIPQLLAQELPIGIAAEVLKTRSVAYMHGLRLLRCRRDCSLLWRAANP